MFGAFCFVGSLWQLRLVVAGSADARHHIDDITPRKIRWKPIQAGDHAEIIEGALGTKGPNVGKTVRVVSLRGEHSEYGRIWKVEGEGLISEYGAVGTTVNCAQPWLRKIEPPKLKTESSTAKEGETPAQ